MVTEAILVGLFGAAVGTGELASRYRDAPAAVRSSLFVVRAGNQDVAIGPSSFLQMTLGAVDRAVDRARARVRADSVAEIMKDLVFDDVNEALPTFALSLMQNLPEEDQRQLANKILLLQSSTMNNETTLLVLGLELMNVVGPETLEATVAAHKKSVVPPRAPTDPAPDGA